MCGIAGAIGLLNPEVDRAVRACCAAQTHRGPDDQGSFRSLETPRGEGVHFAHRRLSIIDLSEEGRQPMTDPETGNVICFNGEIYNYRLLRAELAGQGLPFHTATDTEVILKAYAHWGEDCLPRLRGMFAFALFDARSKRTLVVRDRVGIKPFYYTELSLEAGTHTVLFASEVRALLATGLVSRRLDASALATYVWNGFVVGPRTIVQGIQPLEAGACQWVHADGRLESPRRYWRLPGSSAVQQDASATRQTLLEATQQHMVADVPVGVFLSGGVDSSAVAALAAETCGSRLRTFNIAFEEQEFDESPWARRVASALGTAHEEIRLTHAHFRAHLADALDCLDQPTFDAINTYFVSRAVREAGITVALSGAGGDELLGGYRSFQDLPKAMPWLRGLAVLPERARRGLARPMTRLMTGPAGAIPPQTRWGKLADLLAAGDDLVQQYQVAYALFTEDFARQLLPCGQGTQVRRGLLPAHRDQLDHLIAGQPALHAISTLELSMFVGERLLRDTDMASMRNSLEVRVPLLDHVVIETIAQVAESRRYRPIGRKMLLRDAALAGLDPSIFERSKAGFVFPIEVWSKAALHGEIDATFRDRALCESAGIRQASVAALWQAYCGGAPGIYWTRIWSMFALLHWTKVNRAEL